MNPQQVIDKIGGGSVPAAAKVLKCTRQALYRWRKTGIMPELYDFRAQAALAARKKKKRR